MHYAIGIDIGTTTVCGISMDCQSGKLLKSRTRRNNAEVATEYDYESLQNPEVIWSVVQDILDELWQEGLPRCIGISCQMHGILYVDQAGSSVSHLYTWQDRSAAQKMPGDGMTYVEYLNKALGTPVPDGYGLGTHYYLQSKGLIPAKAKFLCTIGDYVAMKLCGGSVPRLHHTNGAALGGFLQDVGDFDRKRLEGAGVDCSFLPSVTEDCKIYGHTTEGVPVAVALGDNQASFLGSVRDTKNTVLINIGTGSQISTVSNATIEGLETRPFFGGERLSVGSSLCGGRAYAALIQFFKSIAALAGKNQWESVYEDVAGLLATERNHDPIVFSTLLCGTRENPKLRGSITNLSLDNFTPEDFAYGTLMGMVQELFAMYQKIPTCNQPLLVGSGNGIRKNAYLRELIHQVFGVPVNVPEYEEEACVGACLYAMVASGVESSLETAQHHIRYQNERSLYQ